jgi:hypothetical protein
VIGGVFGDHSGMKTARVLLLCSVAAITACHRDETATAPVKPPPHVTVPVVKKGPSAAELTNGMVEAASQGKSDLAVQVKFDLPQRPTTGQPVTINIAVLPRMDAGPADIDITGGDGLTVASDANHIELATVEEGAVYRQAIRVTPTMDGVLILSLNITLKHDDETDSRVFSIPLIVQR